MDINYNALFELDSDSGDTGTNTPPAAEADGDTPSNKQDIAEPTPEDPENDQLKEDEKDDSQNGKKVIPLWYYIHFMERY